MLTLVILLGAAAVSKPLPNYKLPPAHPVRCRGACAEQYRLPLDVSDGVSSKDRAMAEDGTRCNVVGAKRCLSKRRTILRSNEDPMDTLRSNFLPQ